MDTPAVKLLAEDAIRLARERFRVPRATYRLQMHRGFTLRDALAVVPYLDSLGVSHVYTSSLLAARPGSLHGYDVVDHGRLNPELGTEADLAAWVDALHVRGMGLILDVVPNHMCVAGVNAWWHDVLEHGPSSPFANHFDIAWDDHPRERLHGKVLLPILGDMYGKSLESGVVQPEFAAGAFSFKVHESRLPIDPRTYDRVLNPALDEVRTRMTPDCDAVLELQSVLMAVTHLPPRDEPNPSKIREGRYEIAVIKRRLADLVERNSVVAAVVQSCLERLKGIVGDAASFAALDEWIGAQAYRPAFWRVAADEINYRRFFDVSDLAAISTEREDVFLATHSKVLDWLASGVVNGLRIDHPDGLYDPKQYLDRLQLHYLLALARRLFDADPARYGGLDWDQVSPGLVEPLSAAVPERLLYVVVEKILGTREKLPADWSTHGTTGYEFLAAVNSLFVDKSSEAAVSSEYARFAGQSVAYEELVYRNKFLILQSSLAGELHMLAHQLDRLAQMERGSRDFTLNSLRHALREAIACFPVYRTYVTADGVNDSDRALIQRGLIRARRRNPLLGRQIFDFIRDTLLLKDPPSGPASDAYRAAQRNFVGRFQQVTSPVMAKGVEDTTFYVFNRLVSLNEVGGDPAVFGTSAADAHAAFAARAAQSPHALSPLATHDTKRGADVRARINVLSEMPEQWAAHVQRWAEQNRPTKVEIEDGQLVPDANEEYLLYQTLVGTWQSERADAGSIGPFAKRIQEYMNKVVHEAKTNTSWINPNADYDAAITEFVKRILDPEKSAEFLSNLREFCGEVQTAARRSSLAQVLLQCATPGVPDVYQGTELLDDSLVDPDNRRPVDYERAAELLEQLDRSPTTTESARAVVQSQDGRPAKLYLASRALRLRRSHPEAFQGGYVPLDVTGERRDHVFAFLRRSQRSIVFVAVPRLVARARAEASSWATWWADTAVQLPLPSVRRVWRNVLDESTRSDENSHFRASGLFDTFPVALMVCDAEPAE